MPLSADTREKLTTSIPKLRKLSRSAQEIARHAEVSWTTKQICDQLVGVLDGIADLMQDVLDESKE